MKEEADELLKEEKIKQYAVGQCKKVEKKDEKGKEKEKAFRTLCEAGWGNLAELCLLDGKYDKATALSVSIYFNHTCKTIEKKKETAKNAKRVQ